MTTTLIKNIGTLVSGDIKNPILNADSIFIEDGVIKQIGNGLENKADTIIDCQQTTIAPGFIDSHCHVVLGDFTPRQSQLGFIESAHHGGVTTFVSAGEVHLPGRPKDPAGTKALAILAHKSFNNFRPGGAKVLAGSVILEKGLVEADFDDLAKEGIKVVGEIGLGSVNNPKDAAPMVKWAKKRGMVVMMHTGGNSIPGSSTVTADMVIETDPDIVSHINGGPTAIAPEEIKKLVNETELILEIVHCGNIKAANTALEEGLKKDALHRFIIGNDAPSGTGVVPLGILRTICHVASLTDITPEKAIAMATGNTAKVFNFNYGTICEGKQADLIAMDTPMGSIGKDALNAIKEGDIPGISMVMVDGKITLSTSKNTPPANKKIIIK